MPRSGKLHLLRSLRGRSKDYLLAAKSNIPYSVAKIRSNLKSRKFAELLDSDRSVRRLFFHHWMQLTAFEGVSIPFLFSADAPDVEDSVLKMSSQKGEEQATFTIERMLDDAQPAIERSLKKFVNRLRAAGMDAPDQNAAGAMLRVLDSLGLFSGSSPMSGVVRLIKPFEDYFADDLPEVALLLAEASKSKLLAYGMARRRSIARDSGLSEKEYESAITRLLDSGVLSPAIAILWCNRHGELPLSSYAVAPTTPIFRASCGVCRAKLKTGIFYLLTPSAMVIARHYEGCIPYLLAWDLERNDYYWNAHVYLAGEGDVEKDLVFLMKGRGSPRGSVGIVECKTYRTDVSDRVIHENLRRDLAQLSNQVESYKVRGIPVGYAILACNYEMTPERKEFASTTIRDEPRLSNLKNLRARVLGIDDLSRWWVRPDS